MENSGKKGEERKEGGRRKNMQKGSIKKRLLGKNRVSRIKQNRGKKTGELDIARSKILFGLKDRINERMIFVPTREITVLLEFRMEIYSVTRGEFFLSLFRDEAFYLLQKKAS